MAYHSRQNSISSSIISSSNVGHPQKIGPWKLGKTLGSGATGRVLLATHQTTGQKAAVKVVSKSELQDEDNPHKKSNNEPGLPYGIEREIIIMKLLTHPNVLRLYDVWETSKALYLVLEYVEGGELFDLLVERGPLDEAEAIKYFRQIILGTAYCHALGICHRDLKPENLLLDASLNVKLADFGMAALESNGKLLETSCGSPHYAAPEIVSGLKYHGAASDVWSCGVILFALLSARLPFDDENIRNLLLKVQAGTYEMPDELSNDAKDLINKMLTVDPIKRIPTEKILHHPLLNKYPIPNEDLISVKSLPHPETAYKSLGSAKNIDRQILSNLSILWHDRDEQDIVKCLLKNGQNPEKTFYALLMRYRHNQDNQSTTNTPRKGSIRRNGSANTPKRKRQSQKNVSRPTSFQYRNGNPNKIINGANGKISASSSVNNSPRKRFSYAAQSPRSPFRSPRKYGQPLEDASRLPVIPRNIYNEINNAQSFSNVGSYQSMPPSLPSKDTKENPIVDEVSLMTSAKIDKRNSIIKKSNSRNRLSKRMSMRASMTTGLKRNSITMKLLSTYAKLSGDNEWEYVDKQAKRTSATFATLCDKIFNQEDYNEDDENLVDEEEKQAKEYERLMEIERKKYESELKARKELEKKRKREKRKSLLSSRKLSILIRDDNAAEGANNSEHDITSNGSEINQPKRQSKYAPALRSLSEGNPVSDELTQQDLDNFKRRSATQPIPKRRQTPVLTRRPVSKLDPLWQAYENEELNKAKDALEAEWRQNNRNKRKSNRESIVHKNNKRDSMISVIDDHVNNNGQRVSRENDYENDPHYELPEPDMDDSNLSEEYQSEIRKSRLLNSQLNLKGSLVKKDSKQEPKTLIGNVKIPNVTRKSRNFTNSNKRLSVLSMYSTKESYHDLSSIINTHAEGHEYDHDHDAPNGTLPGLRTSFADRLDKAGLVEEDDDEEPLDEGSIMDFEEHLANKRQSYYGPTSKRNSRYSSVVKSNGQRPTSKLPQLPTDDELEEIDDYTFATKNDAVHNRKSHSSSKHHSTKPLSDDEDDDDSALFDNIKLPDANGQRDSVATSKADSNRRKPKSMLPSAESMLIPDMSKVPKHNNNSQPKSKPQPYQKVRQPKSNNGIPPTPPTSNTNKKPLADATNKPEEKRSRSIFRKLSWGSKKTMDEPVAQLPSPADSRAGSIEVKKSSGSGFFGWFSSSSNSRVDGDFKRFNTILPKYEMSTALFALLNSWSNFGLKNLKNDLHGFNITGSISTNNAFNLKSCKFRIKINARDFNQKSEIVCARVKGSKTTTDTLFKEIEKVLRKEGVLDN
ncbi:hypothetical protein DFJ63DRAFT_288028 [Scheffersomyces coipomensis]|uniref:uncharacterized protein n=1 Tax=Scheffersomyces coipomensis TaxID=1788519 RepID=UPI00315DBB02